MKMEEQEKNSFLKMTISDPELVQKIRESGIESLSPDDINSLGIEVKNGHMSLGDASQANFGRTNRIRMNSVVGRNSGSSPLNRGLVGFFAILLVILIGLSTIGIITRKIFYHL